MSWLLKKECKCGGDVLVIEYEEKASRENNYKSKVVISHGVCIECLSNIPLPSEDYFLFTKQNCYWKKGI